MLTSRYGSEKIKKKVSDEDRPRDELRNAL